MKLREELAEALGLVDAPKTFLLRQVDTLVDHHRGAEQFLEDLHVALGFTEDQVLNRMALLAAAKSYLGSHLESVAFRKRLAEALNTDETSDDDLIEDVQDHHDHSLAASDFLDDLGGMLGQSFETFEQAKNALEHQAISYAEMLKRVTAVEKRFESFREGVCGALCETTNSTDAQIIAQARVRYRQAIEGLRSQQEVLAELCYVLKAPTTTSWSDCLNLVQHYSSQLLLAENRLRQLLAEVFEEKS